MAVYHTSYPALKALSPEARNRILEQGMRSPEYQKGYALSEKLGWAFILATVAGFICLINHRLTLVLCILPVYVLLGIIRIRIRRKLLRMLEDLAATQQPAGPSDNSK
jgi:hypothetical protein